MICKNCTNSYIIRDILKGCHVCESCGVVVSSHIPERMTDWIKNHKNDYVHIPKSSRNVFTPNVQYKENNIFLLETKLGIPLNVMNNSRILAKAVKESDLVVMSNCVIDITCVYIACRMSNFPISIPIICKIMSLRHKKIEKCLESIKKIKLMVIK